MSSRNRFAASLTVAIVSFSLEPTLAQTTERVSVSTSGTQGDLQSSESSISADGRFVAFASRATTLVAGDTNSVNDVFVRDRQLGTTERVSVSTSGTQGNSDTAYVSISADGRFVAFHGIASNLVVGDTNGFHDVFVRDRTLGTTERVSVSTSGAQGNNGSGSPSISADGRFVAFASGASTFVAGDTNGWPDIFVRDRTSGTTERVSVDSSGVEGNSLCFVCSISADGRIVAFVSDASNLVAADTNGSWDAFVHDRTFGTTERVSVSTAGVEANSRCEDISISADGRFVAFDSYASNLVPGDTNFDGDTFVHDRQSGTTERVSLDSSGAQGFGYSVSPSISGDGRFVAFVSNSSTLVAGDTNSYYRDSFVRDRQNGTTELVSVALSGGSGNTNSSGAPSITADGRYVAFASSASNLVAGDTNGRIDTFFRDRGADPVSYCTSSTSSSGCIASITASASPSASLASTCNITVTNVEGQKSGILFYGVNNSSYTPAPWAVGSTSLLCVKPPTQRTPIQDSGGTLNACNGSYLLDWNAYQSANPLALGNPWSIGAQVYVQAWFRDPSAVKSTSLSNALEMTYMP